MTATAEHLSKTAIDSTGSRIRSASLASNGGASHHWRAASADARR